MNIDLTQFLAVFYEESFEGLAVMEHGLLALPEGPADREVVDAIFRAAHSIKGGAGTFGLGEVTAYTHRAETLLDEIRAGRRPVTTAAREALLEATDVLSRMLRALKEGATVDAAAVAASASRLDALLADSGEVSETDSGGRGATGKAIPPAAMAEPGHWQIRFLPHRHFFRTGNEPLRLLRELADLGECRVQTQMTELPRLAELVPDDCHLGFGITLAGSVTEADIRAVFDWVEGDCELTLERVHGETPALTGLAPVTPGLPSGDTPHAAGAGPGPSAEAASAGAAAGAAGTGGPSVAARETRAVARPTDGSAQSIRVGIDKVDALINLVGELVITQSMLSRFGDRHDPALHEALRDGLAQFARNTRELQETVLKIRMLPISVCFSRFPRLVHDLSARLGKQVELRLAGEQTELDKTVLENIGDPLVHLVRNCLDHGIETPERRLAAGKPAAGTLSMHAWHEGGSIVIQVADDGAGLNRERILARAIERGLVAPGETLADQAIDDIIFLPGFSTAEALSEISGRGVGMDVVRRNIQALGGQIEVSSRPGTGTTFTIRLPLTLAILDGQLVEVAGQTFVIPLVSIVESLQVEPRALRSVSAAAEVYRLREDYIPLVRLREALGVGSAGGEPLRRLIVVVEAEGARVGLVVDDLLSQQQVVIKSLESNYRQVPGVSGATILGDGAVALILDVNALVRQDGRVRPGATPACAA
jgi:two-component system chemotaxis sensor kinase CheA